MDIELVVEASTSHNDQSSDSEALANAMPKTVTPAQVTEDPQAHEDQHVHAIYDQIASHFSSTRYKVSLLI
jgi:hypothetical protein